VTEPTLTPEERDRALDAIAGKVRQYRLETPAAWFLELHRPLASFAGLAAHAVTPLFGAFFGLDNAEKYASLLGDREGIDELLERLDGRSGPAPAETP
jgi:hypothetical protein